METAAPTAKMAPRKRARSAAKSPEAIALVLSGGEVWPAGMALQRQQKILCDAELNVDGTEFHAHRCVLAVGSSFFKGLYAGSIPLAPSSTKDRFVRRIDQVSPVTFPCGAQPCHLLSSALMARWRPGDFA